MCLQCETRAFNSLAIQKRLDGVKRQTKCEREKQPWNKMKEKKRNNVENITQNARNNLFKSRD